MDAPKYTDVMQAWTSLCTAIFTFLSLAAVAAYTWITRTQLKVSLSSYRESLRPVLLLTAVREVDGRRIAVWQNTGGGLAMDIYLHEGLDNRAVDNNVLAPGGTLEIMRPLLPDEDIIDIRYSTLTKWKLGTIGCFIPNGRTFNQYVPDAAKLSDDGLRAIQMTLRNQATSARAEALLVRQQLEMQKNKELRS